MMLRLRGEDVARAVPSERAVFQFWGLNSEKTGEGRSLDAELVMHHGPMNRGVEDRQRGRRRPEAQRLIGTGGAGGRPLQGGDGTLYRGHGPE